MIHFSDEKVSIGAKSPVMGRRKSMGGFFSSCDAVSKMQGKMYTIHLLNKIPLLKQLLSRNSIMRLQMKTRKFKKHLLKSFQRIKSFARDDGIPKFLKALAEWSGIQFRNSLKIDFPSFQAPSLR